MKWIRHWIQNFENHRYVFLVVFWTCQLTWLGNFNVKSTYMQNFHSSRSHGLACESSRYTRMSHTRGSQDERRGDLPILGGSLGSCSRDIVQDIHLDTDRIRQDSNRDSCRGSRYRSRLLINSSICLL